MNMIKHLAIILDGNRRFAKRLMMQPWKGHEWGFQKVDNLISWCLEMEIPEITLYAFSMQNFNRPKLEFDFLMNLFRSMLGRLERDVRVEQNQMRIQFIGKIELFPPDITERMQKLMAKTKQRTGFKLNLAMAYGGQEEIIDTMKQIGRLLEEGKITTEQIDKELIENHLYMNSSPDLIIRTGGEKRTSNFLIWQANYSEWIFMEKCWPEFEKDDLVQALEDYSLRERRFGR